MFPALLNTHRVNNRAPKATDAGRHVWKFLRMGLWGKVLFTKSSFPQVYIFIKIAPHCVGPAVYRRLALRGSTRLQKRYVMSQVFHIVDTHECPRTRKGGNPMKRLVVIPAAVTSVALLAQGSACAEIYIVCAKRVG
jgi:hypothetical protein